VHWPRQLLVDCPKDLNNPWYGWRNRTCYSRVFFVNQSAIHPAHNVQPLLLPATSER
jgi:hypothetical protein